MATTTLPKIISKEQLDKFCPSYQKVILELEKILEACEIKAAKQQRVKQPKAKKVEQWKKRINFIKEFANNYLMPGEYWLYLREAYEKANKHSREKYLKVNWKAYEHLFYDRKGGCLDDYENYKAKRLALLKFDRTNLIKEGIYCGLETAFDISFPHRFIEESFKGYQKQCKSSLSREVVQKYQRMKDLYTRIKAAEARICSVEEWFGLLCEAENHEFVCHNAEYRLGMNLADKELWILYINYLQKHDPQIMLQLLSKYCRVFLDDAEMKQKYKEAVAKYGPVIVKWTNIFEFETAEEENDIWDFDFDTPKPEKKPPKPSLDKSLFKNFCKTYQNQTFCFKNPIVYIFLNMLLQKQCNVNGIHW
uniref:Crooked neck protein n=1 Tax=Panagrolaimus superbus TaxID=310955 RepID=A0A914YDX5_9BILA